MALLNVLVSGAWRVSVVGGRETASVGFSTLTPLTAALGSLSVYAQQDYVLGTAISEFRISHSQISSPQLIMMAATNEVRVNFAGETSQFSAASASVMKFRELFIMMDISGVLPSGISIGNSGTDSATVTVLIAG